MNTLGGSLIICDGLQYDYPFIEAIWSLLGVCDQVSVLCFSDDDERRIWHSIGTHRNLILNRLPRGDWDVPYRGRFRLSYFTNLAKSKLTTDWHLNLQGDEIIHEDCYRTIREAMEYPLAEAFLMRRVNLWQDPYHVLKVPVERRPVADYVVRLAKMGYDSVDDAENIQAPFRKEFEDKIRIYHMGFVRSRNVHNAKIINMQEIIFGIPHDTRCDDDARENKNALGYAVFRPETRFSPEDLVPITEPLPMLIRKWAEARAYSAVDPFEAKP